MPIIARDSSSHSDSFEPAPAGIHRAICCDVVDQGMVPGKFGERHKVRIVWQLETPMADGKPYMASRSYGLTLSQKGDLRKDLEAWRGKPFTLTEASGFDVERVVGKQCTLFIAHAPREQGGGVWANVTAVLPKQPGAQLVVRDYVRVIHREGAHQSPPPIGPSHAPPPTGWPPAEPTPAPTPVITADDIPFAWLFPLMLPALVVMGWMLA